MVRVPQHRLTNQEAVQIRKLSSDLGERRFRTLMQGSSRIDAPPISRKQYDNWIQGKGSMSYEQQHRLRLIQSNSGLLKRLAQKSEGKSASKSNRAMRDWLIFGKERSTPYDKGSRMRAIIGLGFLGVDPSEGTFYVIRRK